METTVRRGGKQTPDGFLFEISGGDLCLDFANTVDMRPAEKPKELLTTPRELYSWSLQAGMLSRKQETFLQKLASEKPVKAEAVLRKAIVMRECLYRVLQHVADETPVPPVIFKEWNGYVRELADHYELASDRDGVRWRPRSNFEELDSVLWPVIHSAVVLVTGSQASRIRRCAADNCDWTFLDTSKRGNRRWCDMTVCGNRAKAKRFYRKSKETKQ